MAKLFKLKEWLPLPDVAHHLALVFGEEVTETDVLRLALDGHLQLSVYFVNGAKARCGRHSNELENRIYEGYQPPFGSVEMFPYRSDVVALALGKVTSIFGIWNLPLIDGDRSDIENRYQSKIGGPRVPPSSHHGTFVEGNDGELCQIQRVVSTWPEIEYEAAGRLPDDCLLVVRTDELRKFESTINGGAQTQLGSNERNTLLTIIATLCDYSDIDIKARGAASQIARFTEEFGAPVTDDTVRRVLSKIPDALEGRMK